MSLFVGTELNCCRLMARETINYAFQDPLELQKRFVSRTSRTKISI